MRAVPLQFLTWGTVTAAVSSALWLSSSDQDSLFCAVGYHASSRALGIDDMPLPTAPTRAGPAAAPGSGAPNPALAS